MSILDRIATLTKAALHEGLNRLEDPVMMTGQYLRDLDDQIADAERRSRDMETAARLLERRLKEYRMLAELSEGDAIKALEHGDEMTARAAVEAKLRYTASAQECEDGLEETRQVLAGLAYEIAAAKEEQTRLKAKRAELAERARRAAASPKPASWASASASAYGLDTRHVSRGFQRMEDKIREWEAGTAVPERYTPETAAAPEAAETPTTGSVRARAAEELQRLRDRVKNVAAQDAKAKNTDSSAEE
ncbi:PspA/IM30 family protein [Paenibacillus sp. HN-1]|uniref:PspA/IM30 family protein n=1 Tax=Paenibacillus TaxID=44249 RepID=UPI001CA8E4FD|nr:MULTISPECIES: PspA/IM30 family protein [Paenibacillus]MBY9080806.1 PspA/IM30 family protein [Paenibacillus sp. CGMCC 1.18879]MBY9085202.1 PspA/IM30 family protein [Paenibacillus sinensis]